MPEIGKHNLPLPLIQEWDGVTGYMRNKIIWVKEGGRALRVKPTKRDDKKDVKMVGETDDS